MSAAVDSVQATSPLGASIPALVPHAISVSLPTWKDVVGYEEGEKRVVDAMQTGYPRFFVHLSIQKLANICLQKFGLPNELCTLLPTQKIAQDARSFFLFQSPPASCRIVEFVICPSQGFKSTTTAMSGKVNGNENEVVAGGVDCIELQILLYDKSYQPIAKQFWQHTGNGISSRMAERGLAFLGHGPAGSPEIELKTLGQASEDGSAPGGAQGKLGYSRNRHYSRTKSCTTQSSDTLVQAATERESIPDLDDLSSNHATFLEERYGRNLPLTSSNLAKLALRRRIAGTLLPDEKASSTGAGALDEVPRGSRRGTMEPEGGAKRVTADDVYLYPTGMSAIWHAHQLAMTWKQQTTGKVGKSVCFGFPYTDTLKILQKWGPGCHFFGHGTTPDLDSLESLLARIGTEGTAEEPPITALFCEFPSNPLLRSADLKRIRELADQYGFIFVVDETVGNFVNVEVASWADVVVSSLTKVFSGETNVMGGSLVLTPHSRHYQALKATLEEHYEDLYFAEDAVYMERNSRDFRTRIATINDRAYDLTEMLYEWSQMDGRAPSSVLKYVWYPRWVTPEHYAMPQRLPSTGKGGFGGLFSLTFTTLEASRAFFDVLDCHKGPSLGTNFTLACPYTILAHYAEQEWADSYGVEPGLIRVSVGLESIGHLKAAFGQALDAAQRTQSL